MTESSVPKVTFLKRIHKETPMFYSLFQEKGNFSLGILKGFQTGMTEIHGIMHLAG